jgi:hypothetical protein
MKTKNIPLFVLFLCVWSVQATPVVVKNYSFELPGLGKLKNWELVPGWSSDTIAADSGIDDIGWVTPTDGSWIGYLMGSDPNVWQVTDAVIVSGQSYELKVDVIASYFANSFSMALFYYEDDPNNVDFGTRVQVASSTVAITGQWQTFMLTFNSDDVPASIGKKIGIELDNPGNNWLAMDNVRLDINYVGLVAPAPNGVQNVAIDTHLVWNNNHSWNVDVYLSDPYNEPNSAPILTQVISNEVVTSYDPPANLQNIRWYYWRVDAREPNGISPDIIHQGPLWSFKTVQAEPIITFNNVITTMDILPATMSATVVNPGTSATFTLLDDDYRYPTGAIVTLTPDVSNSTAPTVTVDADMPGTYKIKFTVSGNLGDFEAIAELVVYADACQAKKDSPSGWVRNYYDRNGNCVVELNDFAVFAREWLDDTSLTAQVTY